MIQKRIRVRKTRRPGLWPEGAWAWMCWSCQALGVFYPTHAEAIAVAHDHAVTRHPQEPPC